MLKILGTRDNGGETSVTIEASLRSPEGQQLIDQVAKAFNIDDDKANTAVRSLTDEVSARIQRSMLSRGGVADVAALVTNPAAATALTEPETLATPQATADGNQILDVLIGNKHISRKIAARTASRSDLDTGTVEKLLPAVASLVVAELQRQAQPALDKVVRAVPGLIGAGGSPLPMPGDTLPSPGAPNDWNAGNRSTASPTPRGSIDPGQPLPIPGDSIPGVGRSSRRSPEPQNPFERLPDILRRGGQKVPGDSGGGGGGSLEDIIRSIFGKVLGSNRGVIGTMIQLFLIRWIASLVRRVLSGVLTRK